MFTRLCATSVVAVALLVPSLAFAQDPAPADAPPAADAGASTADVPASAAPAADAGTSDAAAADTSDGRAGDPLPIAQSQRPLVLPHMVLSPYLGVGISHFIDTGVSLGVGASLGLADIAEVEVSPFQSALAPNFEYGAVLAGTVRLLDDQMLELGARLKTVFTTDGVGISPGMPVRLHATDMIRVDTGVYVGIVVDNPLNAAGDTTVGLSSIGTSPLALQPGIPLEVTVSPIDEVWVGAGTGFGIFDFGNAGDSVFVPLGLNAGGTIPVDGKPLADLGVGFGFPLFINTGTPDAVFTDLWALNFTARANLDLADMMQ